MRAYMDKKEALFTMGIERQRTGIARFISSHPGTPKQEDSVMFSGAFTIKISLQVKPSGTLLQYSKHKNPDEKSTTVRNLSLLCFGIEKDFS